MPSIPMTLSFGPQPAFPPLQAKVPGKYVSGNWQPFLHMPLMKLPVAGPARKADPTYGDYIIRMNKPAWTAIAHNITQAAPAPINPSPANHIMAGDRCS